MKDKYDVSMSESLSRLFIPYINVLYQHYYLGYCAAPLVSYLASTAYVDTGEHKNSRTVPFLETSCKKAILSGEKQGYYVLHHSGVALNENEKPKSFVNDFLNEMLLAVMRTSAARKNHWWIFSTFVESFWAGERWFSFSPLVAIRHFLLTPAMLMLSQYRLWNIML